MEESEERHREGDAEDGMGIYMITGMYAGDFKKSSAVYFRMQALSRLIEEGGAKGWTLPGPDGSTFTEEAVLAAAAVHPLVERDKQLVFDRESFLERVLELAKIEGEVQ